MVDKKINDILFVTLIVIAITQGMSLLFKTIPHDATEFYFISNTPFYFRQDINIMPRSYVWRLFEKINTVLYFWVFCFSIGNIYSKSKSYLIAFVVMKLMLVIEYILSYNSPWFSLSLFGHSFKIGLTHFFIIFTFMILGRVIYSQHLKSQY